LAKPDEASLAKLPPAWKDQPGDLLVLKLREDVEEALSADKEFALYVQAEKENTRATLDTAKVMNKVAMALGVLLGAGVLIALVYFSRGQINSFLNR
jgi:hypothetical protein